MAQATASFSIETFAALDWNGSYLRAHLPYPSERERKQRPRLVTFVRPPATARYLRRGGHLADATGDGLRGVDFLEI